MPIFTKEDLPQLTDLETMLTAMIEDCSNLRTQVSLAIDVVTQGCEVKNIPVTGAKFMQWTNLIREHNSKTIKWRNIP